MFVCPPSYLRLHVRSSPDFLCMLPMVVAGSSSDVTPVICTYGFMDDVIFAHKPRRCVWPVGRLGGAAYLTCVAAAVDRLVWGCELALAQGEVLTTRPRLKSDRQ